MASYHNIGYTRIAKYRFLAHRHGNQVILFGFLLQCSFSVIIIDLPTGYTNGQVHRFNMQSGIHRGAYGTKSSFAHKGAVRGVETDLCNQRVFTAGADGTLRFWHFKEQSEYIWYYWRVYYWRKFLEQIGEISEKGQVKACMNNESE